MSGGVDSLGAALLLREQGHEVTGLHMVLPTTDETLSARRLHTVDFLANKFAIHLDVIDLQDHFEKLVIQPFVETYLHGRTPNPCVLCNRKIKFRLLLDYALSLGAERYATGHYARIQPPGAHGDRFQLLKGLDPAKDQSYFLHGLTQYQLSKSLFPLGNQTKEQVALHVRQITGLEELPSESQEICFIPSSNYQDFLAERLGKELSREGPVVDLDGKPLGRHRGIFAYTVGQRRGLGIPSTAPYYVIAVEPETNTVRVGRSADLYSSGCLVENVNWVSVSAPENPLACQVRIRNQHRPSPATLEPIDEATVRVRFHIRQRAVTPGQSAVFYRDELVLGGGTILEQIP